MASRAPGALARYHPGVGGSAVASKVAPGTPTLLACDEI
jgi:hypothetical protein